MVFEQNGILVKKCTCCGEIKPTYNFCNRKRNKDGLESNCRDCKNEKERKYRESHKEIMAGCYSRYRKKNTKKVNDRNRKWRNSTGYLQRDDVKAYRKAYSKTPKRQKKYNEWQRKNGQKPEVKAKNNEYRRIRSHENINFKMASVLRGRLRDGLKSQSVNKTMSYNDLLGCSLDFLKKHLESLFTDGMSWKNHGYGNDRWHIDHIVPCKSFTLSDVEEQKKCFHWTNLQPLWQSDNLSKGAKLLAA